MPEKALKKIKSFIKPQWKVCFVAALIFGLAAHLYKITNWLPNWDSLVFRYDAQNMVALGRWFLPVVCSFTSFYDLPFLNGIIAILFHALSAVCICKMLNVRKKITAALIGAIIVTFPTVTSVLMYNYVADGYSIAFFLSTLAAYFLTKKKWRYSVIGAVLIALSTGIYQAYITVTIMLVLLHLIDETLYNGATLKDILKKAAVMLLSGVAGVALYGIILKIVLTISSSALLDYQGINSAVALSGIDILGSLYRIKETFINIFFDFSRGITLYLALNIIVLLFTVTHYIKYIVVNKLYKAPLKLLVVIVMSFMLVLGAGILAFANPTVDYHNLMLMGYAVFYIFFIILYERGADASHKHATLKCWAVFVMALIIIANQVVIANVAYHKAGIAYEKSYGTLIRIADRIEQTENSDAANRIMVIGALENSEAYSINLPPDITGITDGYILRADDETVGQSVLCNALNDYCGKNYQFISGEEKNKLLANEAIKEMQNWPAESSVAVLDNIIIIKLGVEGEQ